MEENGSHMVHSIPQCHDDGVDDGDDDDSHVVESCSTENSRPQVVTSTPVFISTAASCTPSAAQQQRNSGNALEKRRKSNRLSARRWRMRKRSKFAEVHDQIRSLTKMHQELTLEKMELQKELSLQVALWQAEAAATINSSWAAAKRVDSAQRALVDHNRELRANLGLLSRVPTTCRAQTQFLSGTSFSSLASHLQASRRNQLLHLQNGYNNRSVWPLELANSLAVPPSGGQYVSHTEFMAVGKAATAASFTALEGDVGRNNW